MDVDFYAKKIWDYMLMKQQLEKADLIFVLGNNDIRVAEHAAELFLQGYAPIVVCSGGFGKNTRFEKTEAEVFSERMIELGVAKNLILIESRSTNTGENVQFTKELLKEKAITIKKVIAVQKPYMERRTFATIQKQWPDVELLVTSPEISYESYTSDESLKKRFISLMVGDLQRIKEYPALGFQIPQDIPSDVWEAYEQLVALGYDEYLIK